MAWRGTVLGATAAAVLVAGCTPPAPPPASPGPGGGWHLRWSDEFTGSALGSDWVNGWFPDAQGRSGKVNAQDRSCPVASNVAVGESALHLLLTAATLGCSDPYAGALVSTNGHVDVHVGEYVEARVRATGAGTGYANTWAFWLDGQHWPDDGEIDIAEAGADGACWNVHDGERPDGRLQAEPGKPSTGCARIDPAAWHTIGALRTVSGQAVFFYDGNRVGSLAVASSEPMYIIVSYSASDADPVLPAGLDVDYVRVYSPA